MWVDMLDRIYQQVPTNPDAREVAASSRVTIRAGRNAKNYTLLQEVDAYLELANTVALLLCRALDVQLREPVMAAEATFPVASIPERRGVSLPTRRQCAISTMSLPNPPPHPSTRPKYFRSHRTVYRSRWPRGHPLGLLPNAL